MVIRALDDRESYYEYDFILKNLVRKAGLLPYLNSEFETLDYKDKVAIECFKRAIPRWICLPLMKY